MPGSPVLIQRRDCGTSASSTESISSSRRRDCSLCNRIRQLWVVYSNSIKKDQQVVGTGYNMGPGWGWGYGGAGPRLQPIRPTPTHEGTLIVDIADANGHQLLWRGSATNTISDNSDKNIKNLNNAVNKLFKNFPPKPGSK